MPIIPDVYLVLKVALKTPVGVPPGVLGGNGPFPQASAGQSSLQRIVIESP